ncbi:MAG: acyl carrier protein [Phycisphaerae bacterium]|nr:acyl carrier protein [Phycisphaerae bacterium]
MATVPREEILEKVQQALVDALSVEDDEVTEEATLTGDLQAESIDILDIVFRLEKAFNIKISQEELTPRDILDNPEYVDNRKLNAAGLAALKERFTHADYSKFEQDPDIDKILDVFTVGTIVNFVEHKLATA